MARRFLRLRLAVMFFILYPLSLAVASRSIASYRVLML